MKKPDHYEPGTEGLTDPNHHLNAALESIAAVARELKKERDEAREALENHKANSIHSCHDGCKRPMCVLRRERDEARERVLELKAYGAEDGQTIDRLIRERDEAREALREIAAADWKTSGELRGMARRALEGAK